MKKIVFIRHGESEENVHVRGACKAISRIRKLKSPSSSQMSSCLSLLKLDPDPQLSTLGKRQVTDMAMILNGEKFWESFKPDIVVYSPLKRVSVTAERLIGDKKVPVQVLECLREVTPMENIFPSSFHAKVRVFEEWLATTASTRIVVVGHCQYFRYLLKEKKLLMRNCDVWEASVDFSALSAAASTCNWLDLKLLYRTHLAKMHPFDKYIMQVTDGTTETDSEDETETNNGEVHVRRNRPAHASGTSTEVYNDLHEEEAMCRICHLRQHELPTGKLIRPCRCTGSQAYVHVECLNNWRTTSSSAQTTCSVCQYQYHVQKSPIAEWISSENGATAVTVILLVVTMIGCGIGLSVVAKNYELDLVGKVYNKIDVEPWWRLCTQPFVQQFLSEHPLWLELKQSIQQGLFSRHIRSHTFLLSISCVPYVEQIIDRIVLGGVAISVLGLFIHTYCTIRQGAVMLVNIGITILWLSALPSSGLARMMCLLGVVVGVKSLYESVLGTGRKIAQIIGEQILEYHNS